MFEFLTFYSLLSFLIIFLLVCSYCIYWYKKPKYFPPGCRGIPVLGNILFFGKHPEQNFKRWSKQYGKVMSVRFGTSEMVVLNDYSSIKKFFLSQLSSQDDYELSKQWSNIIIKDFENKIKKEASVLLQKLKEKSEEANNNASVLLNDATCNVLCLVCFGKHFKCDDESWESFSKSVVNMLRDPQLNVASAIYHNIPKFTRYFDWKTYDDKLTNAVDTLTNFLRDVVSDHALKFEKDNLENLVDLFLEETKADSGVQASKMVILYLIRDLLEKGTEVTSTTLNWALICLLHYPSYQNCLGEEIRRVVGLNERVSWSQLSQMPYTQAFMEEVYRFRTAKPLTVQHVTAETVKFDDYSIPKGTMVAANVWAIHNDEEIWSRPHSFNPERFLNEQGQFTSSQSKYVIPFSIGSKHGLEEKLSRMQFFIFLVTLLQNFEIMADFDILPSINEGSSGTYFVPSPFNFRVKTL